MKKKKHVYLEDSALNLYNDTHFIPPDVKEEIAAYVVHQLLKNRKKEIHILDAGIGHGGDMLIPILEKLERKDNNLSISVEGFDNSERQLKCLRQNLKNANYRNSNRDGREVWESECGRIRLEAHEFDMDRETAFFSERKENFDLVLCSFLLHHLANWRLGFLKLLYVLKMEGSMVFAERIRDIEFLDGNFSRYQSAAPMENSEG